jgi:hypothetical protein
MTQGRAPSEKAHATSTMALTPTRNELHTYIRENLGKVRSHNGHVALAEHPACLLLRWRT